MTNPYNVPDLAPGCPWSDWTRPNVKWCEENLCEWVTNPANTWSNLGFIFGGLLMWWLARNNPTRSMRYFGPASVIVGVTSLVYHASYTFALQFADFVGMFVFVFLLISLNQRRLGQLSAAKHLRVYAAEVIVASALVPVCFQIGLPIQALVAGSIAWLIGQEVVLARTGRRAPSYKWWFAALGCAAAGATCSALDLTRVWCDPHDHLIQGHAMWHILMALSLLCMYRFYATTSLDNAKPA